MPESMRTACTDHSGAEALALALDAEGSLLWYLPSVLDGGSCTSTTSTSTTAATAATAAAGATGTAADPATLLAQLEHHLAAVVAAGPRPDKDTSRENGRAQFFAQGVPGMKVNPRWRQAAWPLGHDDAGQGHADSGGGAPVPARQSQHEPGGGGARAGARALATVLGIQSAVEAAVARLSGKEGINGEGLVGGDPCVPSKDQGGRNGQGGAPCFNSVLVNRYADGKAKIKWHADDVSARGRSGLGAVLRAWVAHAHGRPCDTCFPL